MTRKLRSFDANFERLQETTRIQEKSKGDFRKEFLELVKKGLQTGVTEEEMLSLVRKSCEEEQR